MDRVGRLRKRGRQDAQASPTREHPVKNFWSVTVYDNQTCSMLQTNQQFPVIGSQNKELRVNADGSIGLYFGPKAELATARLQGTKGQRILISYFGDDS